MRWFGFPIFCGLLAAAGVGLLPAAVCGQEVRQDMGIRVDVTNRLAFDVEQQFRFTSGSFAIRKLVTQLGVNYAIFDEVEIRYRQRFLANNTQQDNNERNIADLIFKPFKADGRRRGLGFRLRYQRERQEDGDEEQLLRFRTQVSREWDGDFKSYIGIENFYSLTNSDSEQTEIAFPRHRLIFGFEFELGKHWEFEPYYRFDYDRDELRAVDLEHTIGFQVRYRLQFKGVDKDPSSLFDN